MKIVIDANVVLSAMLRDGVVRRELAGTDATLYAPAFLRRELDKHIGRIARRSGVKKTDAVRAMTALLANMVWIDDEAVQRAWEQADTAMGARDAEDVPYLAVGADAIWSFDTDFDAQDLVPRVTKPG